MIFETEFDDAGNSLIKQFIYSSEPHNAIKRDLFQKLSQNQKKDLAIINHFFKQNLYSNLSNFEKDSKIIKSEEFDSIDFKALFEGLFSPLIDVFKDTFFINQDGEMINRYEGFSLKLDDKTQKIHFEKLPGYEILWKQTEEKLKKGSSSNEIFNLEKFINVRNLNILGIDIKRQFLAYTGEVFKTDQYPIALPFVVEKMFNHLNKNDYLNINSFTDFKRDFEFIKDKYYKSHNFRASRTEYALDEKEISILNDCNLFDFFAKRMSALFYSKDKPISLITNNNELHISDMQYVAKPEIEEIIDPEYIDEISKIINIYMSIQYNISNKCVLFSTDIDRLYLYSEDRGFCKDNPAHRIHNLSYIEFIDYYKLNDDAVSLCFFHYMFEFSLIDKKIDDCIDEMIFDFTKNHEKARVLLSGESDPITIADFNQNVELPLHILNNLCNKETRNLFSVFFAIYKDKVPFEYDNTPADMQKLFHYATLHNKNKFLCEELEKCEYFKSSKNIINFIGYIKNLFEERGEALFSKVDLGDFFNRKLQKEVDNIEKIRKKMRFYKNEEPVIIEKNMEEDEWIDFVGEKIFELLTGNGLETLQENIISNLIWAEKEFKLDNIKVVCSLRNTPCFNQDKSWRVSFSLFDENIQVIDLLDYHFLKGHNEVVYYLKSIGLSPLKKENELTSLDYALIGACNNDILDWICEKTEVKPLDKMNVFGFLRVPVFEIYAEERGVYETLLSDFEVNSFFNYDISNHKNPHVRLDSVVLEKMSYVYKKYKVDFNNNSERVYHLLNKENESFFRDNLNLKENYLEEIKYSLSIKDMVYNQEIDLLKEEIKNSRLTIDMNLMHDVIIEDNNKTSGFLNLLYLIFRYKNTKKDVDFIYNIITFFIDNMDSSTRKNLNDIRCFLGLNVFEIIQELGVHEYRHLIKKLVIDYNFDLKSGTFVVNKLTKKEEFKTYKDLYFSRTVYNKNLYIYFSTQFEKEKIEKLINNANMEKVDRKRM